jgi:hypothetical protein
MEDQIVPRRLSGRCADGAERDGGVKYHGLRRADQGRALCGAKPGRRSAGWSPYPGEAVTCPRCLVKIRKISDFEKYLLTP